MGGGFSVPIKNNTTYTLRLELDDGTSRGWDFNAGKEINCSFDSEDIFKNVNIYLKYKGKTVKVGETKYYLRPDQCSSIGIDEEQMQFIMKEFLFMPVHQQKEPVKLDIVGAIKSIDDEINNEEERKRKEAAANEEYNNGIQQWNLAQKCLSENNIKQAIEHYNNAKDHYLKAAELNPDHPEAHQYAEDIKNKWLLEAEQKLLNQIEEDLQKINAKLARIHLEEAKKYVVSNEENKKQLEELEKRIKEIEIRNEEGAESTESESSKESIDMQDLTNYSTDKLITKKYDAEKEIPVSLKYAIAKFCNVDDEDEKTLNANDIMDIDETLESNYSSAPRIKK